MNRTRPSSRRGFTAIRLRQQTPMRKEISPEPVTSGAIGRRCWSPGRSIGHEHPEHGEGLQDPGLGEGTGVDRLEAEILRQDRDRLLGREVVATEEPARPLILEALLLWGRECEGSRPRAPSSRTRAAWDGAPPHLGSRHPNDSSARLSGQAVLRWVAMGLLASLSFRRSRVPSPRPLHYHYCDGGDHEWPHEGGTCLAPWVSRCPRCRAVVSSSSTPGGPRSGP